MNCLFTAAILFPALVVGYLQNLQWFGRIIGETALLIGYFSVLALMIIEDAGQTMCLVVWALIGVLLLIPVLKWKVRLIWAMIQISASAVLFWIVAVLKAQPLHGPF